MAIEHFKGSFLIVCLICGVVPCGTIGIELPPDTLVSEVTLVGPELTFMDVGSHMLFLLAPQDIEIEKAIFEIESLPIKHNWVTYLVNEIFKKAGDHKFVNYDSQAWISVVPDPDKAHKATVTGEINVAQSGEYEVEALVYQGQAKDSAHAIEITISEKSHILGTKGPRTAKVWEKWGIINLVKGKHEIVLRSVTSSREGAMGGIRLRNTLGLSISRVKDLRICDYHDASPPVGHFETKNLASNLRSGFRNRISRSIKGRNICSVSVSSASPGVLRIHSLRISFVTGDPKLAKEKAKQFVLIYPDGNSSRPISLEELKILATYVRWVIDSTKGVKRNPFKLINLCSLVKRVSMKCEGEGATQVQAEFDTMYIQLAQEEAERLAWSFQGYANDWPKPESFPNKWAEALNMWYRGDLDGNRLTNDGGYLDPWGNPYILKYFSKEKRIQIHSYGPNGTDDGGVGDDIKAEHGLEWPPR